MRAPLALALLAAACGKDPAGGAAPGPQQMPPGEVGVVTVKLEQVPLETELAGRTTAQLESEIRPQITGIVKARLFQEGALVKAGQVLYEIDPSMYRATYAEAQADVAAARAQVDAAKIKDERFAKLAQIEGVSKQEADDARAAHQLALAQVAQKDAALSAARINLDYTQVRAPITGRIGKSLVTPGALVTANQAQPLTTIRSLDPIYVDLAQSSEARLRLRAAMGSGGSGAAGSGAGGLAQGSTHVRLRLPDGSLYNHDGTLQFAEVAVDEATGMVTLRAEFPNPEDTLLPGMYVRAVLDEAIATNAILVPQQGITRDPKGNATAMVVDADGKVAVRPVTTDRAIGDKWLVTSGLSAGDKLIVEGLNKIGPGMPVHATEIAAAGSGAAPGAGSAAGAGAGSAARAVSDAGSGSSAAASPNAKAP